MGRVKMNSFLIEPERVLRQADEIWLRRRETEKGPIKVLSWNVHPNGIFMEIDGVGNVEQAESLVGFHVLLPAECREALPEGEYYWEELIGMTMVTEDGEVLGTLTSIFPTGSNDVYVCTCEKGEMLVPAIDDVILRIDKAGSRMVIRLLEGMDRPC